MTTTSAIPAAIDYLVKACRAAFGETARVFDGPHINDAELARQDLVWIGHNPLTDVGIPEPVVTGDQSFATLGARSRDETFAIVCAIEHWSGSTDMQPTRAAAFALLARIEQLLRGTPASGGIGDATLGGAVLYAQIGGGMETYHMQSDRGSSCAVVFHISCMARLTTS